MKKLSEYWFFRQIWHKVVVIFYRLTFLLYSWPQRLSRLLRHIKGGLTYLNPTEKSYWFECPVSLSYPQKVGVWLLEFLLYVLDLFGVGECYSIMTDIVKFNARPMHDWELEMAREVYGDAMDYRVISLDDWAWVGFRIMPKAHAYVGYHTINFHGKLTNGVLIHELIHIWQYQRFGSVYALRALLAQSSEMQYNYGGIKGLRKAIAEQLDFLHFNFEQQGDLVQDYYRIAHGYPPLWGDAQIQDLPYYEYFLREIRGTA